MLTFRYRKGRALPESLRVKVFPKQTSDERNLEAVERLIPIAEQAGLSLTHMAMAFVMAHPGVTSAILGPRTMQQLDDLLAGAEVVVDDEILDRIDEVVAPGTDAGPDGRRLCASGIDAHLARSADASRLERTRSGRRLRVHVQPL
jgi:aryl-alcohol dehydrogenase-like predicted oxidoreductase